MDIESNMEVYLQNVTSETVFSRELYCVMGCNEALNTYFQKLRGTIRLHFLYELIIRTTSLPSIANFELIHRTDWDSNRASFGGW